MSDRMALRSGGIAGIVYILLAFGAVTFASGSRLGEFLLQLSAVPGLWWVVALSGYLRKREGGMGGLSTLFLIGYLVSGAVFYLQTANNAMLAARPPSSAATVTYLNDVDSFIGIASYFPLATALIGAGLSMLTSGAMPRWIGALALAAAVGQLLITLPIIVDSNLFTDSGPVFAVAQLVLVVWLLSVAIAMLLKSSGRMAPARDSGSEPTSRSPGT